MINAPDRLEELLGQNQVTGIDFIHVDSSTQRFIHVHFLVAPGSLASDMVSGMHAFTDPQKVRIYQPAGEVPEKPVTTMSWSGNVLHLEVASPGDFTLYKLYIDDERLDPYYNDVTFDFKANCPSDLDCKPRPHECPPEEQVDFPVDYLARDYDSYKQALLEFASTRYPHWPDRLEADAGLMLAEVMSALGDEMAYYQDRIAREAYLESATQRRSLRRHARLVDYNLHDGLGAFTWLNIHTNVAGSLPAGTNVYAKSDSGRKILFELGRGIADQLPVLKTYAVDDRINDILPHIWDEDNTCLAAGSTQMYVQGHFEGILGNGKWILLQTRPVNPAQPARAQMVRLTDLKNLHDPVIGPGTNITRLIWETAQATSFEMDLTELTVHGNMLPATAGETKTAYFITGGNQECFTMAEFQALRELNDFSDPMFAVERNGRAIRNTQGELENSVVYLFTLPGSAQQPLIRIGADPYRALPDVYLEELSFDGVTWLSNAVRWEYAESLVGVDSADPGDRCFTLDDGEWKKIVTYYRAGKEISHQDYASNNGSTLRFGDGEFGYQPGCKTVFRVTYRLGNGRLDNVGADTLQTIATIPGFTLTVTNPLPVVNGMDVQTPAELFQLAPEAFRAITYRAVRPEDYAEAAERLDWVQRAGAAFRWTGSWLSAFVTPDPRGTAVLKEDREQLLLAHLNRFRQAGREVHIKHPVYANMDIEIEICAEANAFRGEVKERVLTVLLGRKGFINKPGYFSPDHFTFGTPLRRSTLEATIQAVSGVKAVEEIRFRRRGWFDWKVFDTFEYAPEPAAIIRVENDPLYPERGTLKIYIHGGS